MCGAEANNEEKKCPLSESEWINFLQNQKSQIIANTMLHIGGGIAIFAFFGSLIYFSELRDNVFRNLLRGVTTIAMIYLIILMAIMICIVIILLVVIRIYFKFRTNIKFIDELINKTINGGINSNTIREKWIQKNDKKNKIKKKYNMNKKYWIVGIGVQWFLICLVAYISASIEFNINYYYGLNPY